MGLVGLRLKSDDDIIYPEDVKRLQSYFTNKGYAVTQAEIQRAYREYSETFAAGWLILPKNGDLMDSLVNNLIDNYFTRNDDGI